MMIPRFAFLAALFLPCIAPPATAQSPVQADTGIQLIPRPVQVERGTGWFFIRDDTAIVFDPPAREEAGRLCEDLAAVTTRRLASVPSGTGAPRAHGNRIFLEIDGAAADLGPEGYRLEVTPEGVRITAAGPAGLFYGGRTLLQLLPIQRIVGRPRTAMDWIVPCVRILDRPRFSWRGLMLDCSRTFQSLEYLRATIDRMAYYKLNVLHLHLTDDQGWRVEIEKYPRLTGVGAWRMEKGKKYGGFYTRKDLAEITAYGRSRFVTVMPEIEMPGHSMAALAAYPELSCTGGPFEVPVRWGVFKDVYCAGKEKTFTFLEGVLDEVLPLFPGEYVHIGGDECPKDRWKACPRCRERIRSEGLADEKELQSWFIRRMEAYLSARGKRLVGWDEIMEGGLASGAVVMSWRGVKPGIQAAKAGHDVIMCPTSHCYFDYRQSGVPGEPGAFAVITLEKVYAFDPCPEGLSTEDAKHVLGVQANVWTERMETPERVEFMTFPRACALSETAWSSREGRDVEAFMARLAVHFLRLDALHVHYRVPLPRGLPEQGRGKVPTALRLASPVPGAEIRYTLDGTDPGPASPRYEKVLRIQKKTVVKARLLLPGGRSSAVVTGRFE